MADAQPGTSCRSLLKQMIILPVPCQYTLSLMNFIISNQEMFQTNSFIHNINPLKPTGYVTHQQVFHSIIVLSAQTAFMYLYLSQNKQRLVPLTP
jgi:ethanolamine utilization protein EutP (predicted NTPase)